MDLKFMGRQASTKKSGEKVLPPRGNRLVSIKAPPAFERQTLTIDDRIEVESDHWVIPNIINYNSAFKSLQIVVDEVQASFYVGKIHGPQFRSLRPANFCIGSRNFGLLIVNQNLNSGSFLFVAELMDGVFFKRLDSGAHRDISKSKVVEFVLNEFRKWVFYAGGKSFVGTSAFDTNSSIMFLETKAFKTTITIRGREPETTFTRKCPRT